jgi:hypothetical protein
MEFRLGDRAVGARSGSRVNVEPSRTPQHNPEVDDSGKYGLVAILDALGTRGRWAGESSAQAAARIATRMRGLTHIPVDFGFYDSPDPAFVDIGEPGEHELIDLREVTRMEVGRAYLSDSAILWVRVSDLNRMAFELFCSYVGRWYVDSLRAGVAYRGAIAVGEWARNGSVLVGPGVDEAALWEKEAEWAGVMLSPSAWRTFDSAPKVYGDRVWNLARWDIPLKSGTFEKGWALNWPRLIQDWRSELSGILLQPPVDPQISRKALNTLAFYDECARPLPPERDHTRARDPSRSLIGTSSDIDPSTD